ncbi:DUF4167 domain-containing protein [Hyphomicrobium sp.]|uniref:DUF4167 domain-containing protein n=1 Tax=Hyphomicrobium sp. TaxID=82 RepID=UPI0025B89460|nr:DUF4167 domain-containing protein [Hyphomicrobium sp.]MCC7254231.1 DUF4167 domain-containing protein [Hyphomicrobium sp.]
MRQGQQNRRGRGRNNNNNNNNQHRKGQNPLTRSFESTGPDVKLRGTPAHIAEKYIALARDAQSSGDPVLAENYLQHAEHYNRIIMAFREQQMAQGGDLQNGAGRPRPAGFGEPVPMGDDFGDDEGEFGSDVQAQQPYSQPARSEGQPRQHEGQRYDDRGPRQFHGRDRDRDRGGDRGYSDRHERGERFARGDRPERIERADRPDRAPQPDIGVEAQPRRERQTVPHHEQPEFLRRPVRRPRREASAAEDGDSAPTPAVEGSGD